MHFPETDIDAICVFRTKYITRQEFHDGFVKLLENSEDFKDVLVIQQARVPIIKFVLNGILFDVLFAAIDDPKRLGSVLKQMAGWGAHQLDEFRKMSETTLNSL